MVLASWSAELAELMWSQNFNSARSCVLACSYRKPSRSSAVNSAPSTLECHSPSVECSNKIGDKASSLSTFPITALMCTGITRFSRLLLATLDSMGPLANRKCDRYAEWWWSGASPMKSLCRVSLVPFLSLSLDLRSQSAHRKSIIDCESRVEKRFSLGAFVKSSSQVRTRLYT